MTTSASEMDRKATGPMNVIISPKTTCLFLDILPLEIREMVYRRLLLHEVDVRSAAYNEDRGKILSGPDYWFDLDPAVLDTNLQINVEVTNLFQRENLFVLLSSVVSSERYSLSDELSMYRVPLIYCNHQNPPAVRMTIDIDGGDEPATGASGSKGRRETCMFMIEDLHAACAYLQSKVDDLDGRSNVRITVNRRIQADSDAPESGWFLPKNKVDQYLGPLCRVRGVNHVEIDGPFHPTDKATAIASMRDRRLKANEFMRIVGAQFDEGDKASHEGRLWAAIAAYKAALLTLRGSSYNADEDDEKLIEGRFHGHPAGRARASSRVRLHSRIADTYLGCGKYRTARIYVERIYGALYSMDDRANPLKFPLEIPSDSQVAPETYAELLHVAARISLVHGKDHEAIDELTEANNFDPSDTSITQLMDEVEERQNVRRQHRRLQTIHRANRAVKRHKAALSVVTDRMAKGDEAFHKHDFKRAQKYYETANEKAHRIGYVCIGPWDTADLRPETLVKLIMLYLDFGCHERVHRYADQILDVDSGWCWSYQDVYRGDPIGRTYPRETFYAAYYGKAFTFQKQGEFKKALRYFENAWLCDDKCEATYYQLQALKQMVGTGDEEQKAI